VLPAAGAVACAAAVGVGAAAGDANWNELMKNAFCFTRTRWLRRLSGRNAGTLFIIAGCVGSGALPAAETNKTGQTFPTPEAAVNALEQAVETTNRVALAALFGPDLNDLTNPDRIQSAFEFSEFVAAFNTTNRLVPETATSMVLEVGQEFWPFPIPLIRTNGAWRFDTVAGKEELLNRRIGRNELDVLRVMRAYVDAQREYASKDRDGDDVLEYAQKIYSTPGQTDGLYWPPDLNGELSPLGPLVALAQTEGYLGGQKTRVAGPRPFHGYLFKLLTRQGKHAPGGKYDYIINGNMIGGFGLLAWPMEYGETGVMTFIVNQRGRVYQRDFGKDTAKAVQKIDAYDPEPGWRVSAD